MNLELAAAHALFLVWLLPVLWALYWLGGRLRARGLRRLLGAEVPAAEALAHNFRGYGLLKVTLGTLAVSLLALAMARPVWGYRIVREERLAASVAIALDTSRSMLAGDCPGGRSRLEFGHLKARMLLDMLEGERVGLVAFAGEGIAACPLTFDVTAPKAFLEAIEPGAVPLGGTSLATAIDAALRMLVGGAAGTRAIVLMSDGEDHEAERTRQAAETAREAGIKIITLGLGSTTGSPVRMQKADGSWEYVKDASGNVVHSRLNEPLLKELAAATGGLYARAASGNDDLDATARAIGRLEHASSQERLERLPVERYRWPAAAALACLLALLLLPRGSRVQ